MMTRWQWEEWQVVVWSPWERRQVLCWNNDSDNDLIIPTNHIRNAKRSPPQVSTVVNEDNDSNDGNANQQVEPLVQRKSWDTEDAATNDKLDNSSQFHHCHQYYHHQVGGNGQQDGRSIQSNRCKGGSHQWSGAGYQLKDHIDSPPTPIWVWRPKLLPYELMTGNDGVRRLKWQPPFTRMVLPWSAKIFHYLRCSWIQDVLTGTDHEETTRVLHNKCSELQLHNHKTTTNMWVHQPIVSTLPCRMHAWPLLAPDAVFNPQHMESLLPMVKCSFETPITRVGLSRDLEFGLQPIT